VPGRRGTVHLIKTYKTVVVPITISGFRFAFDKKGLKFKKRGVSLSVNIKPPLEINYNDNSDKILAELMDSIEQSEKFKPSFLTKAHTK
jgi:1-acyl-sn-glycerol-3-phosphate acyltransferase